MFAKFIVCGAPGGSGQKEPLFLYVGGSAKFSATERCWLFTIVGRGASGAGSVMGCGILPKNIF